MWAVFLCPDLSTIRYPRVASGFTEDTAISAGIGTSISLPIPRRFECEQRRDFAPRGARCGGMQLNEQVERCYVVRLPQPSTQGMAQWLPR